MLSETEILFFRFLLKKFHTTLRKINGTGIASLLSSKYKCFILIRSDPLFLKIKQSHELFFTFTFTISLRLMVASEWKKRELSAMCEKTPSRLISLIGIDSVPNPVVPIEETIIHSDAKWIDNMPMTTGVHRPSNSN